MSKVEQFLELGDYDPLTKQTRFVNTNEFTGPYECLKFGNGGSWCRFDGTFGKQRKVVTVKRNGEVSYSWEPTVEEEKQIQADIKSHQQEQHLGFGTGTGILLIRVYGEQTKDMNRMIRKDIRDAICKLPCVVCGCTTNIECDHKNDLYNDSRVNNVATQRLDDFQPLCKHCNDQKRQVVKKTKETGKRYGATNIPSLKALGVPDFTIGNESFDPKSPVAMVGTYWYDPVDFMARVRTIL
jgi:hypothetical protein